MTLPENGRRLLTEMVGFVTGENQFDEHLKQANRFRDKLRTLLFEFCPTLHQNTKDFRNTRNPHYTIPVIITDTPVGSVFTCVRGFVSFDDESGYQIRELDLDMQRLEDKFTKRKYVRERIGLELTPEGNIKQDKIPSFEDILKAQKVLSALRTVLTKKHEDGQIQRFVTTA